LEKHGSTEEVFQLNTLVTSSGAILLSTISQGKVILRSRFVSSAVRRECGGYWQDCLSWIGDVFYRLSGDLS